MVRCAECGARIIAGGYREGEDRFCSIACFTAGPFDEFCDECTSTTTDDGPHVTMTRANPIHMLRFSKTRCPNCHSVVTRKWIVVILPIIPLKIYRVRWLDGVQYIARKLRA